MSYLLDLEIKNIEKLLQEIERLKIAFDLLYRVYGEIGPHNSVFTKELINDINNFFKFDDSE